MARFSQSTHDKSSRVLEFRTGRFKGFCDSSVAVTEAHYIKALPASSIEAMQKPAQNFGQQMGTEKILINA
jgi:hypothetical protein